MVRKTRKLRKIRKQRGGASFHGPAPDDNSTVGIIANYWYNTLKFQCWWSQGQEGYYFTLDKHAYMSQTHVHVFEITDLPNGKHVVRYAVKVNNKQISKGGKIIDYNEITDFIKGLLQGL